MVKNEDQGISESEYAAQMELQRIPKRYWHFDISKLEIGQGGFHNLCHPETAIVISGESGTGKTNLACQILIHSKIGKYFFVKEAIKIDPKEIHGMYLMVLDDLTKIEVSN